MWRVFRPDAVNVLRDDEARLALPRYFAVMEDRLPARFQVCKRVGVDMDGSATDGELWKAHGQGLLAFRKLLVGMDGREVKLEKLKKPEFSLLDLKVELARRILKSCHFCERRCEVDRTAGKTGVCGVGEKSQISSEFMHHGEEPELVPSYTIFFNGCTFKCQYCQNWDISQYPEGGVEVSPQTLARLIASARKEGARNVNFVGGEPIPNLHTILETLNLCEANIPSVWNSNMFLSQESMELLSGTQDVYLADFKYGNDKCAQRYSKVQGYFEVVARNHKLALADAELIIRHLVLPSNIECCTRKVLGWIAENLGKSVRVNLMDQYRPEAKAHEYPEISRVLKLEEFKKAVEIAREAGLENVIT
ncbi:MAG: radical SAM protein [Methanobacteriota archaeon]